MTVRIEQLRDASLLHREGVDAISLPVSRANLHQLPLLGRKLHGREGRVIWRLPFIIWEGDLPWYREAVAAIAAAGFRRFEAANLSHFPLLRDAAAGPEISADYRLFSLNSQALLAWHELGVVAATLYIEDDATNMAALLAADLPLDRRVLVYGSVPAITTKIAIKGVKGDAPLLSDRGEGYEVTVKEGLTVVTPAKRFSITAFRGKLQEMGGGAFVVDLSGIPGDQWPRILDAFSRGGTVPGTSEFNFTMGLV